MSGAVRNHACDAAHRSAPFALFALFARPRALPPPSSQRHRIPHYINATKQPAKKKNAYICRCCRTKYVDVARRDELSTNKSRSPHPESLQNYGETARTGRFLKRPLYAQKETHQVTIGHRRRNPAKADGSNFPDSLPRGLVSFPRCLLRE